MIMKKTVTPALFIASVASASAATTINSANKYAYGANIGWMDWRGAGFLLEIRRWV